MAPVVFRGLVPLLSGLVVEGIRVCSKLGVFPTIRGGVLQDWGILRMPSALGYSLIARYPPICSGVLRNCLCASEKSTVDIHPLI